VEETKTQPGGRRLVLGFDAGCTTCSGLAEQIEAQVGGGLEVRSLRDPQMEHWRQQALGENAPWAPTLVEISGGKVEAWTGLRMGVYLARRLGPAASWKMARILGELRGSNRAQSSPRTGITRSRFITGLGGAVVGVSVLSGTGSLAAAATANEHWLSKLSFSSSKELSRTEAATAWAKRARGRHLRALLSSRALDENPAASRMRGRLLSAAKTGVVAPSTVTIKGVSHDVRGGGRVLALVYQESDALIATYHLEKPGQETRALTRVLVDESGETARILAEAEGVDVFVLSPDAEGKGANTSSGRARRRCSSQSGCPGVCSVCKCGSISIRCAFNCCGPCSITCIGNGWACLGCVLVWCPVCAAVNRCCNYRVCGWNPACN
jgi:hypothetical protein